MFKLNFKNRISRRAILSVFLGMVVLVYPFYTFNLNSNAENSSAVEGIQYFEDDFNSYKNGKIDGKNGWISRYEGKQPAASHEVKGKVLLAEDFSDCNGVCTSTTERPMSEAAVNQRVSVEIMNLAEMRNHAAANVHLRLVHGKHTKKSDISYYAEVTSEYIRIARTTANWTVSDIESGSEKALYTYKKNHIYRVEFSAHGLYPTVLTATLYDVTAGNEVVATASGTDNTAELQNMGTTALSCTRNDAGQDTAKFDNFKYEQIDTMVKYDKFNRADGNVGDGWVSGSMANASISGNTLKLQTVRPSYTYNPQISESALMRPMSEKSLDQLIEVEFQRPENWADIGAVIVARAQSETLTDSNSYRLVTHFAVDGKGNWTEYVYLLNSSGEELFKDTLGINPDARCLLQLSVNSISDAETLLVATMYEVGADGSRTKVYQNKTIDNDPALQKPGTAGVSVFDKWGGKLNIYGFSYVIPPEMKLSQIYPADDIVPFYFEDDFNDESGNIHGTNGWIDQQYLLNKTNFAKAEDGMLILDNGEMKSKGAFTHKLMRPMSEAVLNQKISVDILNFDEIGGAEISFRITQMPVNDDAVNKQVSYGFLVTKGHLVLCTNISWGQGEIAGCDFKYKEGHVYRMEVTAQGTFPTVMTGKLYDVTDGGREVASLTARDETLFVNDLRSAQIPGTVSLSYIGEVPGKFDNFVYEQLGSKIYHDSFNRKNDAPENGWELGSGSSQTAVSSTMLVMNNGGTDNIWSASVMRPMDEKSLEQEITVEYSRPDAGMNTAGPVIFARAKTDKKLQIDGAEGFACYYAELTFTGDWSAKISVYKVSSDGQKTLLGEKETNIYGKLSKESVHLELLAQGSNPTKLDAILACNSENREYHVVAVTCYDSQPELQTAGTAGMSYSNSVKKFAIEKFSYLKSEAIPEKPAVPEDLDQDYMAYFTGTVAAGNFGQWVELEPNKVYVYSVRMKKVLDSGGFAIRVQYNPSAFGHMYKDFDPISRVSDLNACLETLEFKAPSNAQILPNGKARIKIVVHEGGLSSTGYATDFKVYEKDDPNQTNLLVNPSFKKGFYGWSGHGYYIQGAETGGVMQTLGSGEVLLVPYDELAFVRDDSDAYFDDGDWALKYENISYESEAESGVIKGYLKNASGKPIGGATVVLRPGDFEAVTDKKGYFVFDNLPDESYYLSVLMKDGTECEFDELLYITEGSVLELDLTYDGDASLIKADGLPSTGDSEMMKFNVIVSIFALSVMSCRLFYKKKKADN